MKCTLEPEFCTGGLLTDRETSGTGEKRGPDCSQWVYKPLFHPSLIYYPWSPAGHGVDEGPGGLSCPSCPSCPVIAKSGLQGGRVGFFFYTGESAISKFKIPTSPLQQIRKVVTWKEEEHTASLGSPLFFPVVPLLICFGSEAWNRSNPTYAMIV